MIVCMCPIINSESNSKFSYSFLRHQATGDHYRFILLNQSSGYDVYRCHVALCVVVAMTSTDVMHVSNYSTIDIMPVGNANLYVALAKCSSYFRVRQEVDDCLIAVLGSSSFN
jgi:hypothetical protein